MRRSWGKQCGYSALRLVSRLGAVVWFRFRCAGRQRIPATSGGLICANHQSYLDPVLVGLVFNQRLNYLARSTLFRFGPFRWLIEFLDAIPIEREGMGLAGLKETLRRLKAKEFVLIFPEGTRTADGEVSRLKPGFCAVARRSGAPLVPIGFDGAFQAWPRTARLPAPGVICMEVGTPILPEQVAAMTDEELVDELERRIRDCHARARRARREIH